MSWRELAFLDEVAALTDVTPEPVDGTSEAVGTGTAASREDHVHALGPLVAALDFAKQQATNLVIEQQSAAPGSPTQGQIYYDTDDDAILVWVV